MVAHYGAAQITLHVRKSNRAAISLYRDTLGFEVHEVQKSYCESAALVGPYIAGADSIRCRW
jgi:ribosomal protein S18 acetylase RimI-like enzyme